MKTRNLAYLFLAALLLGNALFGYRLYSRETPKDADAVMEKLDLFMDVFQQLRANYVDAEEVDIDSLFDNAIKGMVLSLDPFSEFMTPNEFQEFQNQEEDAFGGIGVQVHLVDGVLTVSSTMKGTPAAAAGILAGDRILAIDGEPQQNRALDAIVSKLRGEPGTSVKLAIQREGETKTFDVVLERARIENESVSDVHVIEGTKTGFLRIDWFMDPTAKQFIAALKSLVEQGIDSLIIDLRDNPGGRVDICVDILSCILPEDSLVATLEGRTPAMNTQYKTHASDFRLDEKIPIAVLGDRGTASAAEITISCLRDYHRAVFIGDRTFGKALVQDVKDLGGGRAVKFTIAKYYTKLRTPIQGRGIRPDIEDRLRRKDFIAIYNAKNAGGADAVDPNVKTALEFFASGAQWPEYQGEAEGDYDDLLPQWKRDGQRHYRFFEDSAEPSDEDGEAAEAEDLDAPKETEESLP